MPDFYSNLLSLERQLRNLRLQHQQTLKCRRTYLAHHVTGHVKWYNVKQGYGFITRDDTSADVFVHKSSITMNNVDKLHPSVGDGEAVEFDVVLVPGRTPEAVNVTGPNGTRVQGSMHSPDRQYRYPSTVVHAAMKMYCENIRAEPSLLDDDTCHLEDQPSCAMVNEAPEPGTSICPEKPFVEPSPDNTTKPVFDYTSYGYLYDSDDSPADNSVCDSTSMYSEGSLHESDFTTPYDSEDEAVNSDCETQTESSPVTLEQSTSTHDLYVHSTGSQESDTDTLLNEITSELAVGCMDQEIEYTPATCTFEQSTSTQDSYMSQYFPTEEERDDLAYACRCLESFRASCCPHLRNKICTFLLLCHLEKIHLCCPSLRMVYVLKANADYLFEEADPHCHLFSYIDIFKRILFKYWNLREHCQDSYKYDKPEIAPLRTVSPSAFVQRLLQENLIEPENATSVNASQMIQEFLTTHSASRNPDDYGHLLDQLVLMFYCSQEQEQMLCTLYNWYRRWQLCYSRAVGKESRLIFL